MKLYVFHTAKYVHQKSLKKDSPATESEKYVVHYSGDTL